MPLDAVRARRHLADFNLEPLFVEELGWDRYSGQLDVAIDGEIYELRGVAEKRGMVAFAVASDDGNLPDYPTRRRVEREAARTVHEHLIVYLDGAQSTQVWQWVKREPGQPTACREHIYRAGQSGEALIQRLDALAFSLDEEAKLTIVDVTRRARTAFDVERLTRRFYDRFKAEHDRFLAFIAGLGNQDELEWYASVMLNRLMFVYFMQKKGFLDGDRDYLQNRLALMREAAGPDRFLSFYRHFLLRLFHEGLGGRTRTSELDALVGRVPYLNGGLFDIHELERDNPNIQIPDEAFERLFNFFDAYQWHLDDRPLRADNEINPDVLGYIFEKYVNQKQMGAYYTKEDITGFITINTLIPRLLEKLAAASEFDIGSVTTLLGADPYRYIHPALRRDGMQSRADDGITLDENVYTDELRARLNKREIASFSDVVKMNLDLRQLAQDVVETCDSPSLLLHTYRSLQSMSVLDPTCGSGAFLFAALNVLQPLYEATLQRMEAFLIDAPPGGAEELSQFRAITDDMQSHANQPFFVLKTIVVNNLYGVDIMEEAVEICKLRLFLKLVSQVDHTAQLEPLPDIDFNIRAGNALVGFTDFEHVRRSVEGAEQIQLDVYGAMERITHAAREAQSAADRHRAAHLATSIDDHDVREAKRDLQARLSGLRNELDRYLASEYGVAPADNESYRLWLLSHQPFHWIVEFYGVVAAGGFDAVIGNPPYIEYHRVRAQYELLPSDFKTLGCGNIYAPVLERCFRIADGRGRIGMIVQLSAVCTDRMEPLQRLIRDNSGNVTVACFDDRPAKLFDGLEHIRAAIIVAEVNSAVDASIMTSRLMRWYADERPQLFPRLSFVDATDLVVPGSYPKLGSVELRALIEKMKSLDSTVEELHDTKGEHGVYYHRSPLYWIRGMNFVPHFQSQQATRSLHHFKELRLRKREYIPLVGALINSSLFYMWFIVFGNGRNVAIRDITSFPLPKEALDPKIASQFHDVFESLMDDYRRHSRLRVRGDGVEYQEFYPGSSKPILDMLDERLGALLGLTGEEVAMATAYDLRFRLGSGE